MSGASDPASAAPQGLGGVLGEIAGTLRPRRGDPHGPLVPMMVALTCVTGVVDAVSYLELGHVFVANMTGNIVFVGFALAGASGLSTITSLVAIGSFLIGAMAGGRLGARSADHRGDLLRAASAAQALLMLAALLIALTVDQPLSSAARYALVVPLALAMGVQNASAQRLAIPELTTTVLTRTLTGIASEAQIAGGRGSQFGRRSVAVAAMLLGALIGALLALHVSIASALAVALALVVCVGVAVHVASRSSAAWTRA
ncbi:MAG TPA: YoaK family protein [Solirubrobacteraceae bacterium]